MYLVLISCIFSSHYSLVFYQHFKLIIVAKKHITRDQVRRNLQDEKKIETKLNIQTKTEII